MDLSHYWFQAGKAAEPYTGIGNSLRFRGAQALSRAGSGLITQFSYTFSFWVKGVELGGASGMLYSRGASSTTEFCYLKWQDQPWWYHYTGQDAEAAKLTGVLRDPSAWYHVVLKRPAGQAGNIYINGVNRSSGTAVGNMDPFAYDMFIGAINTAGSSGFDGYLAEVHGIHGQALEPTEFGETNDNGVWVPKAIHGVLDYGVNGFHLDFSDPDNIGKDVSGPGNDWTAHGFELTDTTSSLYDWMEDSPTQNYATLNPLDFLDVSIKPTLSEGNLRSENLSARTYGTIGIPDTGKFYFEGQVITVGTSTANFGVSTGSWGSDGTTFPVVPGDTLPTYTNELLGCAVNVDDGEVTYYKNNVSVGTVNPSSLSGAFVYLNNGGNWVWSVNFGQRPFTHTPPAGFEPLQTQELPEVTITNPSDHFEVFTDTGANILTAAQAKFPNGLWWIKDRANANEHQLVDSVRGNTTALTCPNNQAQITYAAPSGNSVAWCWEASDDFTSSAGTSATTGKRNTASGFSVFTSTVSPGDTMGHGLTQAPEFIISKTTNHNFSWRVWHQDLGIGNGLILNSNGTAGTDNLGVASVNATTYGVKTGTWATYDWVHYCWHSVPGYSAFGSYTGNGDADGPFIYTGFKPAFVMIKNTTQSNTRWLIHDSARNTYNPATATLAPNLTDSEVDTTSYWVFDFLSNGLKIRSYLGTEFNYPGNNFIYAAFAEHPFGGSNISPTTAR